MQFAHCLGNISQGRFSHESTFNLEAVMSGKEEDLEKTVEAGFIALVAVALQIRSGKNETQEVSDPQLLEAKLLINRAYDISG
jgi:hypothetical protein